MDVSACTGNYIVRPSKRGSCLRAITTCSERSGSAGAARCSEVQASGHDDGTTVPGYTKISLPQACSVMRFIETSKLKSLLTTGTLKVCVLPEVWDASCGHIHILFVDVAGDLGLNW